MKMTISKKLNGFIIASLLTSILSVVSLSTSGFTTDLVGLLHKDTVDVASIIAGRVRSEMRHVADISRVLSTASLQDFKTDSFKTKFIQDNIGFEKDVFSLALLKRQPAAVLPGQVVGPGTDNFVPVWRFLNPDYQKTKNFQVSDFDALDKSNPLPFDSISKGAVEFNIAKLSDGTTVLRVGMPFVQSGTNDFSDLLVVDLRDDLFTSAFAESTSYLSYLVDKKGTVIGSSDPTKIAPGTDLGKSDIFAQIKSNSESSLQMDFYDSQNEYQIGAFQKVGFADLVVISQVPFARAHVAKIHLLRHAAGLGATILFLALALGLFFSQTLSEPIEILANAAGRIEKGDFNVQIFKKASRPNPNGDEIHHLSHTFDQMVVGLREREKVKAALSTYHSKELVDKVLSGELKIGGERKEATVLFTDIRGFTTMSENMDPALLFQILNQYLSKMVDVIYQHGGHIDKFIGDGILAVWGVPDSKPGDTDRAVQCCLAMRRVLQELNDTFKNQGVQEFHIGMGLNYGPVIAGNIGSSERMEYTIIGDTVNTATRIEALTKVIGTDLLVSEGVLKHCSGQYTIEDSAGHRVKGRAQEVQVYKVLGYADKSQGMLGDALEIQPVKKEA
jgi:adenylate cyclase